MSAQHRATSSPPNTLLTGRPGIGKTTVLMRLAERLAHRTVAGFYTEEIRTGSRRQGFRAVTFSGREAPLAHVNFKSRCRVGRYGVDIAAFEDLVLPELGRLCDVMLIDEIGKMECFSDRFQVAVRGLLNAAVPVVATVAVRGTGFIAEAKARPDVAIWKVTADNRAHLPDELLNHLPAFGSP